MARSQADFLNDTVAFLDALWELTLKDAFAVIIIVFINTLQKLFLIIFFDFLETVLSLILLLLLFDPLKYAGLVHGSHLRSTRPNFLHPLAISSLTKGHLARCISLANITDALLWGEALGVREIVDVGYSKAFLKTVHGAQDF